MKTVVRTFQLYLKPNKTATKQLDKILFGCNFLYNELLKEKIKRDKNSLRQPNLSEWSRIITKLREENDCLKIINRQILNEVIMRVNKTWQNHERFKKTGLAKRYPRIKQFREYTSFTYPFGKHWVIEDNRLFLPQSRIEGKNYSEKLAIKIILHQEIKGIIQNLTIKKKNNRWYALFVSEVEIEERIPTSKYIGMDLNCKKDAFCALSNGVKIKHPQNHKKAEKKLIKAQKILSRKQLGSKNRDRARLLYSKQWERVNNQQRDSFFKMAKEFEKYDGISREDLKIVNMLKNKKLTKAIQRASWGKFNQIFGGRVEDTGRQLVKVQPHYTTQKCSNCQELSKEKVELRQRIFKCWNCQFELDRDINSARNILDKAIQENKFQIRLGFSLCREATGVASLKQEM